MRILAIISHKGGAGKTTTAVMLAEELAERGYRVVLVDADRQHGAGLLLGVEEPNGQVQRTTHQRLRYLCSAGLPLRELPNRAEDLMGLFDLAVVDTPSLDDPLARGWLQLATDTLLVLPVEPISLRTIDAADGALSAIRRLNPDVRALGLLPTMFNENNSTQRSLMLELRSRRAEGLLSPPIPADSGLAHRAEQVAERRTQPSAATRQAYHEVVSQLLRIMQFDRLYAPAAEPPAASPACQPPAPAQPSAAAGPRLLPRRGTRVWAVAAAVVLVVALGMAWLLRSDRAQNTPEREPAAVRPVAETLTAQLPVSTFSN